jgi:chemotaxis protein CheD
VNAFERELPAVYLKPGEIHYTEHPIMVTTVLGSCLSITMFNLRMGLAAICHCLLPACDGKKKCTGDCRDGLKYVECSIRRMAKLFEQFGVARKEIEVKFFGGADMFSREIEKPGLISVGRQNVIVAGQTLASEGLILLTSDVGGPLGRKIVFYTDTGDVFLKRLKQENSPDIK